MATALCFCLFIGSSCTQSSINIPGEKEPAKPEKEVKKEKKVSTPKFSQYKAIQTIEYDWKIYGGDTKTEVLPLGYFKVNDTELKFYADLAANGLVSATSEAIMDLSGNYSKWINVALTEKGAKYVSGSVFKDNTVDYDPVVYSKFLNPDEDRDAYGRLWEDPNVSEKVKQLLANFYVTYAANEKHAIKKFCESEFCEAYERLEKIDTYKKMNGQKATIPSRPFSAGLAPTDSACQSIKCFAIPMFKNCYKIQFANASSLYLILTDANDEIFDLVLDVNKNSTIRVENKKWSEARLKEYIELTKKAKAAAAKSAGDTPQPKERNWYAPGLETVIPNTKPAIKVAEERSYVENVSVCLWSMKVDKIDRLTISTEQSSDPSREWEFTATARVIYKIVKPTPFQFILSKYEPSLKLTSAYIVKTEKFSYSPNSGWYIE